MVEKRNELSVICSSLFEAFSNSHQRTEFTTEMAIILIIKVTAGIPTDCQQNAENDAQFCVPNKLGSALPRIAWMANRVEALDANQRQQPNGTAKIFQEVFIFFLRIICSHHQGIKDIHAFCIEFSDGVRFTRVTDVIDEL